MKCLTHKQNGMRKIAALVLICLPVLIFAACEKIEQTAQAPEKAVKNHHLAFPNIPYKGDDMLILDSDLIITGTVEEIGKSKWSNPNFIHGKHIINELKTDIFVGIDEILYGESQTDTVAVRIDGGEDETTVSVSTGYPDFTVGEKVLMFLEHVPPKFAYGEDYYLLVGMNQGVYNLETSFVIPSSSKTANTDKARYINLERFHEGRVFEIGALKQQIKDEHEKRPNYREERAQKEAETRERNKELFGE